MTRLNREEWLARLQTFDRAWVVTDGPIGGYPVTVVRLGNGRLVDHRHGQDITDLVWPLPPNPWGECPSCGRPHPGKPLAETGRCQSCVADRMSSRCPGGCRTQKEHDASVLAQRRRCGLAAPEGTVPS